MEAVYVLNKQKRNALLAYVDAITVEAGAKTAIITNVNIEDYPFQYVTCRADGTNRFSLELGYTSSKVGPHGNPVDNTVLSDDDVIRADTEWVEAKGDRCNVWIHNKDTVAHTYDVRLYGVG